MAYMVQGSRNGVPSRRSQSILVVDDKLDTLLLVRELLSSRGYNVNTASDADEALQAIRAERPDLILLDVIMPGRSGYDLCRELKDDPATRLIPVVMITGLSDRSDRIRYRSRSRRFPLQAALPGRALCSGKKSTQA